MATPSKVAQHWQEILHISPTWAKCGQTSTRHGRSWLVTLGLMLAQLWPNFSQIPAKLGQVWSTLVKLGPASVKLGPTPADVGQFGQSEGTSAMDAWAAHSGTRAPREQPHGSEGIRAGRWRTARGQLQGSWVDQGGGSGKRARSPHGGGGRKATRGRHMGGM